MFTGFWVVIVYIIAFSVWASFKGDLTKKKRKKIEARDRGFYLSYYHTTLNSRLIYITTVFLPF